MSTPLSYLTIGADGDVETEVKRSRFLCRLRRVEDEAAARAVVEAARKQYWDARHHCSAFVIRPGADLQRSSDDGEPAGTAGAPMLEVLRGRQVTDVIAVVTRYFGGTLLGAGGLARAYGDAVRAALDEVGTRRRMLMRLMDISTEHAQAGRIEHELRSRGVAVRGMSYGSTATIHVAVPAAEVAGFDATLAAVSAGLADSVDAGTDWVDAN